MFCCALVTFFRLLLLFAEVVVRLQHIGDIFQVLACVCVCVCRARSMEFAKVSKDDEIQRLEGEVENLQKKVKDVERELDNVQVQLAEATSRYDIADKRVSNVSALLLLFSSSSCFFN